MWPTFLHITHFNYDPISFFPANQCLESKYSPPEVPVPFQLQLPTDLGTEDGGHVGLTRHSTEVAQDGPCVIGEDREVPSMPAEERGTSQGWREEHLVPKMQTTDPTLP